MNRVTIVCIAIVGGVASIAAADSPSLVRDGDRVVFVGDSITGQGMNIGPGGFINLFKAGLDAARPDSDVSVVPLGGSGQTVGSWQNVEKQSRGKETYLDVKNIDVREALDRHADILIVMLGMNDSLSPSMDASPASLDAWAGRYRGDGAGHDHPQHGRPHVAQDARPRRHEPPGGGDRRRTGLPAFANE
jgi:lysophospholipase L1-like esterase